MEYSNPLILLEQWKQSAHMNRMSDGDFYFYSVLRSAISSLSKKKKKIRINHVRLNGFQLGTNFPVEPKIFIGI